MNITATIMMPFASSRGRQPDSPGFHTGLAKKPADFSMDTTLEQTEKELVGLLCSGRECVLSVCFAQRDPPLTQLNAIKYVGD